MKPHRPHSFTLVELLVVIAIIGVLVSLLFPAIKTVISKGETSVSNARAQKLVVACNSWQAEYGNWPSTLTSAGSVTPSMVSILNGSTATFSGCNQNLRGIKFLEYNQKDVVNSGSFAGCYGDAWQNPFYIIFDPTLSGQLTSPTQNGEILNVKVAVFSAGPDRLWRPGSAGGTDGDKTNLDNIVTWK